MLLKKLTEHQFPYLSNMGDDGSVPKIAVEVGRESLGKLPVPYQTDLLGNGNCAYYWM